MEQDTGIIIIIDTNIINIITIIHVIIIATIIFIIVAGFCYLCFLIVAEFAYFIPRIDSYNIFFFFLSAHDSWYNGPIVQTFRHLKMVSKLSWFIYFLTDSDSRQH